MTTRAAILDNRRNHERRGTKCQDAEADQSVLTDQLIRQTLVVMSNCGVDVSPSKVARLVRAYKYRVAAMGFSFESFIANQLELSAIQQQVVADELRKVVAYSDPTGETAVHNVKQERGF